MSTYLLAKCPACAIVLPVPSFLSAGTGLVTNLSITNCILENPCPNPKCDVESVSFLDGNYQLDGIRNVATLLSAPTATAEAIQQFLELVSKAKEGEVEPEAFVEGSASITPAFRAVAEYALAHGFEIITCVTSLYMAFKVATAEPPQVTIERYIEQHIQRPINEQILQTPNEKILPGLPGNPARSLRTPSRKPPPPGVIVK